MLELIALIVGILWLGMGLFEGKLIALFRSFGTQEYRLILKGAGYASAGVIALYSSTLPEDSALVVLIIATIIFGGTWFFLHHIQPENKEK